MRLTQRERQQLQAALGCSARDLTVKLRACEKAAREEYLRMILGQKVFTRGQDIREYRLFLLIRHLFDGKLPDERTISNLFQTTAGQSRTLLRAVLSKYQYELREAVVATLRELLTSAQGPGPDGTWEFATDSDNRIEALNRELSDIDPTLAQVSRKARTVSTYEIDNASHQRLRERFDLD